MQQLYAKIKRSSKYYYQNDMARREGNFPFPVTIKAISDEYKVSGGPGGTYRLSDVNLFIRDEHGEVRIR